MKNLKYVIRNYYLYLLILPAFLLFFIFRFVPIAYSVYGSVTQYRIGESDIYVGSQNYINLFKNTIFQTSIKTTIFFTVVSLIIMVVWAIMIALALNVENVRLNTFFKVGIFLPYVTSWVVMSIVWRWFFNPKFGLINVLLGMAGMEELPNWLGSTKLAIWCVIIVTIWKLTGLFMVIYLANLKMINPNLYEAASVDGGNLFQKFWYITLPQLKPSLGITTIMGTIFFFRSFTIIYSMTGGDPANSTNLLVYYIYRIAFTDMRFNEALSGTIIVLAFIIILFAMEFPILRSE